jgi:exopolysaccharide biosynthesis polyprenyl glycosylphosphotransferase
MTPLRPVDELPANGASRLDVSDGEYEWGVPDLVEAMNDQTRALLHRKPKAHRGRLVPRSLLIADLVGLTLAYAATTLLWGEHGALGSTREFIVFVLTLPGWVLVAKLHGLYHRDEERVDHSTTDDIVGVFHLVTIGVWVLFVATRVSGRSDPGIYSLIVFWALAVCIVPVARMIAREVFRRTGAYQQNTLIVGAGDVGQLIGRKLCTHPEYGINVVGFVDRHPRVRRADLPEHLTILGGPERLRDIIESLDIERVVIAFSSEPASELLVLLRQLQGLPVQIDLVPRLFEFLGPRVTVHSVEGVTLLGLPPARDNNGQRLAKRAIDVIGASVALIALSPLLAYISLRIRLDSEGPVLFRQSRLGRGGKEFTVLKFRTMRVETDQSVHRAYISQTMSSKAEANAGGLYKLDRVDAVTNFGSWLRRTSLDELPQLVNVLRGDMSLVGPRPCIPYETEHYQPHHFERFSLPQGITGLWQVTARANSTYGESLEIDVAYVRSWSLGLDLRLLLRTPREVIRQRSRTK